MPVRLPVFSAPPTRRARPAAARPAAATLLLIWLGAALGACGDEQRTLDQLQRVQSTADLGAQADSAAAWQPTAEDPVTVRLAVPARVPHGTPVPVRVVLHNGSPRPVSVGLGQNEGVEVVVARVDKPAQQGAVFGPMQLSQRLARGAVVTDPIRPGADSTFEVLWPQTDDAGHPVPTGQYRVRAVVSAQLVAQRRMWTGWATVVIDP